MAIDPFPASKDATAPQLPVLTVTEVTQHIKGCLETVFPLVCVQGEVSNCTRAGSGHIYFTLKDETAQLRAVVWRSTAMRLRFDVHDGLEVLAVGPIDMYPARGTIQLVVEQLVPQGIGALELAFRQLQEKLAAEGLFDPARKRPIPRFPRRIALVTSPTGAAVRDMLQVMTRRWRCADVVLLPVAVQGPAAANEIAAALRSVHQIPDVDVVVTGRGGGSLEDLWAFNEEVVARAIYDCPIPVVSAVGHEIDVSIADLVADRRALTPSEAAELVVPNCAEVEAELRMLGERLAGALRDQAGRARMLLESLATRRVLTAPFDRVDRETERLRQLEERLGRSIRRRVESARHQVTRAAEGLDALSPLQVLGRGYSITRHAETGRVVRRAADVQPGEMVQTILGEGRITSRVEAVEDRAAESPSTK